MCMSNRKRARPHSQRAPLASGHRYHAWRTATKMIQVAVVLPSAAPWARNCEWSWTNSSRKSSMARREAQNKKPAPRTMAHAAATYHRVWGHEALNPYAEACPVQTLCPTPAAQAALRVRSCCYEISPQGNKALLIRYAPAATRPMRSPRTLDNKPPCADGAGTPASKIPLSGSRP